MFGNLFGCKYRGGCDYYGKERVICNDSLLRGSKIFCGVYREKEDKRKKLKRDNAEWLAMNMID